MTGANAKRALVSNQFGLRDTHCDTEYVQII